MKFCHLVPIASAVLSILPAIEGKAQVIPDRTLGSESSVVNQIDGLRDRIDGGATRGSNLFHSFSEFSVPTGGEAFFNNATTIDNIITRITGGSISNIDGLIRANGTANLFFLNPNGIVFGPNARLDIGGSFLASTAEGIKLGERGLFSATNPEVSNLLSVRPRALFANAMAARTAQLNNQGNLAVRAGSSLTLQGGEVRNTGNLTAPRGTVAILGEKVGLFENARIDVSSLTGGGNVEEDGGGIKLTAGTLSIADSVLATSTSGEGDGGGIELSADTLSISNSSLFSIAMGEGDGGGIELSAGTLSIANNSVLATSTSGEGDVGGIELTADTLSIADSELRTTIKDGDARGIELTANTLSIADSVVATSTAGKGDVGGIELTADTLSIADSELFTSASGEGDGGGIELIVGTLSIANSNLTARTFGEGEGGDIKIEASESIDIFGADSRRQFSGLFATSESVAIRESGNIIISTPNLNLGLGAAISTRTRSASKGGDIEISTNTLSVTGGAQILASSFSSDGSGGRIEINATEKVTISGRDPTYNNRLSGFVETKLDEATRANSRAGVAQLTQLAELSEAELTELAVLGNLLTFFIDVDTAGPESAILSDALSTGNAGSITLTTNELQVNSGAKISVSSAEGAAGSLNITANLIDLNNGTVSAETARGNEGNINLTASDIRLFNSSTTTTNAQSDSTGGNITINTNTLILEQSNLTARAVEGRGGNIRINAQGIFTDSFSRIDASSDVGIDGTVEINNQLEPTRGLVELSASVVDASNLVTESCAANADSSFIITGRGGLPPNPTGLLRGRALWLDERITSTVNSKNQPLLIEATGWITHANGQVELVSQHPFNDSILGSTLNNRASILFKRGQTQAALETWQKAAEAYQLATDRSGVLGALINQAQALQSLGLNRRAIKLLEPVNQLLKTQPDTLMKAIALQSFGVTLQAVGELERSTEILQNGLAISQRLGSDSLASATLLNLGNAASANSDPETAIKFYQQAAFRATAPLEKTEALLNLLAVYVREERGDEAKDLLSEIEAEIANLPASRDRVYAQLNLASSLMAADLAIGSVGEVLKEAIARAQELEDRRGEAIALQQLASLYQKVGQLTTAQTLTEKSLLIAEGIQAKELVARSQSQLGKLLKQQRKIEESIMAYSNAVKGFESLRKDLVATSEDVQFDFRDTVEPAYRELVGLLLRNNPSQSQLKQAVDLIETLQLAELDNFFQDACLEARPEQLDAIDLTAAVIYPIILPESLEIILLQRDRPIIHRKIEISETEVETAILRMRRSLLRSRGINQLSTVKFYDWLIEPFEEELASNQIKTLVFVLDGNLRNLPMAALYDREKEQYLVEKYAIALTPGLQLLKSQSLQPEKPQAFTAGISQAVQGFASLPAVEWELEKISEFLPSQKLLNQEFTGENLAAQTEETPFSILHLATHGQFSSNRDETFILAWDKKIKVTELEGLLRRRETIEATPIELLVLSACQTAKGDKRAALGLAGVAVRSGARSTLATLWSVQDDSTARLIVEFYRQLTNPNISKAEALRRAQVALLKGKYKLPYFWAPFVLVGNWQ